MSPNLKKLVALLTGLPLPSTRVKVSIRVMVRVVASSTARRSVGLSDSMYQ